MRKSRRTRAGAEAAIVAAATALAVAGVGLHDNRAVAAVPVRSGVLYSARHGLRMDVYEPSLGAGPYPGLVLLHPGGFVSGNRTLMADVATFLAEHGYVAMPIDYRLAPQNPFPAAVLDCQQAVRFVRANAGRFHVDPTRIGVFGASAGANLAAMVGWLGKGSWTRGSRVAAVVAWSGPLDLGRAIQRDPALRGIFSEYLGGTLTDQAPLSDPALVAKASPVTHLDPSDPPSFIANSRSEIIPISVPREAADRLRRLGIPHRLVVFSDGHALDYTSLAEGPTLAFLDRYLRGFRPSPSPSAPGAIPSATGANAQPTKASEGTGSSSVSIVLLGASLVVVLALSGLWRARLRGKAPRR